jgi:hypothetical protein
MSCVVDPPIGDFREALFDWMDHAGISRIEVAFDGYGDSGQIEGIECFGDGYQPISPLPDLATGMLPVPYREQWFDAELRKFVDRTMDAVAVQTALEELVFYFLDLEWEGWEINDGSCGSVSFMRPDRRVIADISIRYTMADDHRKEF